MPDELELEMEELKNKLKADDITPEEYWDNIQRLEVQEKQRTHQDPDKSFYRDVSGAVYRGLIFVLPLVIAGFLLYLFFFYYPPPSDIGLEVSGAGIFPATTKEKKAIYRGLELIRDHSTDDYEFVQTYVDTIEVAGPLGWAFFSGRVRGYYQKGPDGFNKKIRIVRIFDCPAHCSNEGFNGGDLLLGEFMIHEACHSMQFHNNKTFSEPECYEMQFDFARKIGPRLWKDFREEVFVYEYDLILDF